MFLTGKTDQSGTTILGPNGDGAMNTYIFKTKETRTKKAKWKGGQMPLDPPPPGWEYYKNYKAVPHQWALRASESKFLCLFHFI